MAEHDLQKIAFPKLTETQLAALGGCKSLRELNLIRRTGVTIVRVNRSGIELTPRASLKLQFGDRIVAVGPSAGVKVVEAE